MVVRVAVFVVVVMPLFAPLFCTGCSCLTFRAAERAGLEAKGLFQVACLHEITVFKDRLGWAIGHNLAVVDDDGSLAEVEDHVEIMGGNNLGVLKAIKQFDKAAPRLGVEV